MLSDIEIAQKAKMQPIADVAKRLGIPDEALSAYGRYKAKVSLEYCSSLGKKPDGKLILVTAISPPRGRGQDHDHGRAWATRSTTSARRR
jgi:formate--tetrahydrofolate ligase